MNDITPIIVIYKPSYKFYSSNVVMRAGFRGDSSKTEEEKKEFKERYSINPAKLRKISTDKDRIQNYHDWGTFAQFPSWYYSKKQTRIIAKALEEEMQGLSEKYEDKYPLIKSFEKLH